MFISPFWGRNHNGQPKQANVLLIKMHSGNITIFYIKIKAAKIAGLLTKIISNCLLKHWDWTRIFLINALILGNTPNLSSKKQRWRDKQASKARRAFSSMAPPLLEHSHLKSFNN